MRSEVDETFGGYHGIAGGICWGDWPNCYAVLLEI
jgi:hypothetical protein